MATSGAKKPTTKQASTKKTSTKAAAKKTSTKAATAKKAGRKTSSGGSRSRKAKVNEAGFDAAFLDQQKESLLAERAKYLRSAEVLKAEADALVDDREPGDVQFDEESGEGDTLAVERERDLALSAQARAAVEEIDAALVRIEQGTYGICLVSGEPIPAERLEAIPWATTRVEYKAGGLGRR